MPVNYEMPGVFRLQPDETLVDFDHSRQEACAAMHRVGVWIDQDRLERARQWLQAKADWYLTMLQDRASAWGMSKLNPLSNPQLIDLYYTKWGLEPPELTELGDPSVSDGCVRTLLNGQGAYKGKVAPDQKALMLLIRQYKRIRTKWLGTTIEPLRAGTPFIDADGRCRANWSPSTIVGRYGCQDPSLQVIPHPLRWVVCAAPGNVYGGADADQIHLRIAANLWNLPRLLEVFERGGDPHAEAAIAIYGADFQNAPGWPSKPGGKWSQKAKKMRDVAKTLNYAVIYGASAATVLEVFLKTEDPLTEDLIYLGRSEADLQVAADKLIKYFDYEKGWDLELGLAGGNAHRKDSAFPGVPFSECALSGRRRYYHNGIGDEPGAEFSDCVNFRVLTFEASFVKLCTRDLVHELPWNYEKGWGLVVDAHDGLTAEGPAGTDPEKSAMRIGQIVADALTRRLPGHPAPYTAAPCGGRSLAEA